jgi:hypothetical protein
MAGPDLGALGATFKICRVLQAVSLIAIIGMTANFVAEIVSAKTAPPAVLIGTLSVVSRPPNPSLAFLIAHEKCQTSVAVLYCVITFILFMDGILPFLVNTAMDSLLLIAVIVVAVTVGKPLSYLDCKVIGQVSGAASSAYAFTAALGDSLDQDGGKIDYNHWIGGTKSTCLEMKSIWGLSIALWYAGAYVPKQESSDDETVSFSHSLPSAVHACGAATSRWHRRTSRVNPIPPIPQDDGG